MEPLRQWNHGEIDFAESWEEMPGRDVKTPGRITRREAVALTGLGEEQARYHLRKLNEQGRLELVGAGRGAYYRLPQAEKNGE